MEIVDTGARFVRQSRYLPPGSLKMPLCLPPVMCTAAASIWGFPLYSTVSNILYRYYTDIFPWCQVSEQRRRGGGWGGGAFSALCFTQCYAMCYSFTVLECDLALYQQRLNGVVHRGRRGCAVHLPVLVPIVSFCVVVLYCCPLLLPTDNIPHWTGGLFGCLVSNVLYFTSHHQIMVKSYLTLHSPSRTRTVLPGADERGIQCHCLASLIILIPAV